MGKKKKNIDWYNKKMKNLKMRKRAVCSSIPDSDYDMYSTDDGKMNNKTIKKLKEGFKQEKRSLKRAERKNWKEEAQEILDNLEYEDDIEIEEE